MGNDALVCNTGGSGNVAVGVGAAKFNTTGTANIAIGTWAGVYATTGIYNIYIGNNGVGGESNTIRIGFNPEQTKTFVAGIRGTTTGMNDAVPVVIDSNGQLGTINSSQRFKEDIHDMGRSQPVAAPVEGLSHSVIRSRSLMARSPYSLGL